METELARSVDVMMTWAKRIYILIIKVNKLFSFFSSRCFLREIENMYSVFLSSYTNTRESLGELEKAVETLAYCSCSHSISRSPKLSLVFLQLDRNSVCVYVFYFLNNINFWAWLLILLPLPSRQVNMAESNLHLFKIHHFKARIFERKENFKMTAVFSRIHIQGIEES